LAVGCTVVAALLFSPAVGRAQVSAGGSSPSSGTLGPAPGSVTTQFDPVVGGDAGGMVAAVNCTPGLCSTYQLKLQLPAADSAFYQGNQATLTFHCAWTSPPPSPADDVDCLLFSPTGGQTGPGHPDTSTPGDNFEDVVVNNPPSGTWTVQVEGAATVQPTMVTGTISLALRPNAAPPPFAPRTGDPHFTNFDFTDNPSFTQGRDLLGRPDAGEPSVGVDWSTGKVMYMSGNQVTQITYDNSRPPRPTPVDVTPSNSKVNEDAILFTDRETNRTWALGLLLAGSHLAYSDDDGATWTPSVAFSPPALPDHETLGAGPYHQPAPSGTGGYAHAVYYCAQTIVQDAYCGRSDDGGMTFSAPATRLWNGVCSPLHGHVRVGPTGIVYVPNSSCTDANGGGGRTGVAVSVDNGQSFNVSMPPDSSPGTSDPSVMEGPDGTVYLGYQASDGHPMVAAATHDADGTLHWRPSADVGRFQAPGQTEDGLPYGVQNTEFSEVITGDPGRAAFAFLGTGRQGPYQDQSFTGVWYLYISYTFDGGKTWRTVNATPHDPVQRGCVWNQGGSNPCRNMLDFNDIGVDKQGHVYVAYTDGCTTSADYSCDTNSAIAGFNKPTGGDVTGGCQPSETSPPITSTSTCTFARVSAIVRQVCGRGLAAASDPGFNESPNCGAAAPRVSSGTGPVTGTVSGGVQAASALPNTAPAGARWPVGLGVLGLLGIGVAGSRRRRRPS
jgi:LPXTG-motif cell wall-anchored protein